MTERELLKGLSTSIDFRHIRTLLEGVNVNSRLMAGIPSVLPVDANLFTVSSGFGIRTHPIKAKKLLHSGIDIPVKLGTTVYACAGGYVTFAGWKKGYGYYIEIEHSYGFKTMYAHLQYYFVQPGQFVGRSMPIGTSGNTGLSTGPHLHFAITKNDYYINPLSYCQFSLSMF